MLKALVLICSLFAPLTSHAIDFYCKNSAQKTSFTSIRLTINPDNTGNFLTSYDGKRAEKCDPDEANVFCAKKIPDIVDFNFVREDGNNIMFQTAIISLLGETTTTLNLNKKTGALRVTSWKLSTVETKPNERYEFKREASKKEWESSYSNNFQCE